MMSRSLYFKLLREDLKRRTWAAALLLLAFFFALPVQTAMIMENAKSTAYYAYNNYQHLVFPAGTSQAQKAAKILEMNTRVIEKQVQFGNGLVVFCMILAALIMGVSGFVYLHNRKKVDFYHGIPVRRELLYAVQYTNGIWIGMGAYLVNLLLQLVVARAYGVPFTAVAGTAVAAWLGHLLFYLLNYGVAVLAMMLTGHMLVGILGAGVLSGYFPLLFILIYGYCQSFFLTVPSYYWNSDSMPLIQAAQWSSPGVLYVTAAFRGIDFFQEHVPGVVILILAAAALAFAGLGLYRIRPSEAAGRAMAFRRTQSPIRLLIVFCSALAGGMFFFALQSSLFWLVFGTAAGTLLSHCMVEIIYHFDFKKLFSHKLQLAAAAMVSVGVVLSFYFDWTGYDSYLPKQEEMAWAAVDVSCDSQLLKGWKVAADPEGEEGRLKIDYYDIQESIVRNMQLTDTTQVLALAREGRDQALRSRKGRFSSVVQYEASAAAAGEERAQEYPVSLLVVYTLNSGRQVGRSYSISLSQVMDAYQELFAQEDYKKGLYPVLSMGQDQVARIRYMEKGQVYEPALSAQQKAQTLLSAYQQDLRSLTAKQRMEDNPVGALSFLTPMDVAYEKQEQDDLILKETASFDSYASYDLNRDLFQDFQKWPVYPSFSRTLRVLKDWGIQAGESLNAQDVSEISVNMEYMMNQYEPDLFYNLSEEELEQELKQRNFRFEDGYSLVFENPEEVETLLPAFVLQEDASLNGLCPWVDYAEVVITRKDGQQLYGLLQLNRMSPQVRELMEGTPLGTEGSYFLSDGH